MLPARHRPPLLPDPKYLRVTEPVPADRIPAGGSTDAALRI